MLKLKKKTNKPSNPQGISATSNDLHRIAALALLLILIPVLLGFAYLAAVRDPAIAQQQTDRVASSYARQQALNIQQMIGSLANRMQSAAKSPLALSAIGDAQGKNVALIEQTMLDYFPEVISLRILPIGEMGTAGFQGGNQGLRNHIEVDLVRRTSEGENTQPESYQFEGTWLTSLAFLVAHPRLEANKAVIIATLDNSALVDELKALGSAHGRSAITQYYPGMKGESSDDIAATGAGASSQYTRSADISDTDWKATFTPSEQLLDSLLVDTTPVMGVAVMFLITAITGLGLVLVLFQRSLKNETNKAIAGADRKTPLQLNLPEMVPIAKQLRRATLRSLRQSHAKIDGPESSGDTSLELSGSDYLATNFVDDDEVLDLDVEISESPSSEDYSHISGHIFRAYDIRGNAKDELDDELVAKIGGAIGTLAHQLEEQAIIVGCDGRTSSPRLKAGLIKALMESGRDVIDIGTVPTPLLYFATRYLDCKSGVMITGSHNPAEDNGFKVVMGQKTIAAGGIKKIRDLVSQGKFTRGAGRTIREDVVPAYIEEVVNDIAIAVPLKIVIDAGNGVAGAVAPQLFEELGCEVVPLHCELDGRFPNHPPDPSNEDNLADLIEMVKHEDADFGVAFDGDGDRLAVVTGSGQIIRSDVLLMIYAQDVVSRNPGADVVFDVKCSRNLSQIITRHGGRPVLWKTGHAFMKEKMLETGALLGGEFSGHMFFGERWFGFDDGMYAAGRLAEILSTHGATLDEEIAEFPASTSTPEIRIPVEESAKFPLMERIINNADFSSGKVNTLDGIRVDYQDGWGLVRASNTSAALTARFEATSEGALEVIKHEFRAQIALVEPSLELDF